MEMEEGGIPVESPGAAGIRARGCGKGRVKDSAPLLLLQDGKHLGGGLHGEQTVAAKSGGEFLQKRHDFFF